MPGLTEGSTPSYISSQSADVILSDVRPFKLRIEALHAINVLLDEFLYSILNTAGSLLTDRLRASLLSLLPTSLGKEALLEAEVELRAFLDRKNSEGGSVPRLEDDSKTFHLQWSFELLRMRCEAYSTLNESDEDPSAEDRIRARFAQSVNVSPDVALLDPAALYLTAILEAMCEHILTNVGRVAARDSSRVSATVNDLFTALCEDDSIYGLFRSMRVYEQIELLSKGPIRSRRSKSFSRSELSTTLSSRTGSPHQDLLSGKDSISVPRSRLSSEAPPSTFANMPGLTTTTSRSSVERARSLKMYKNSMEGESLNGHRMTESLISEKLDDGQRSLTEESALQEFDDLMRSSATMRVSLTPDRLKTMEVYKQEKDIRRRPAPLSFTKSDNDSISSKRPSLRHVDSIVEDEEEVAFPQPPASSLSRSRQGSVAMIPTSPPTAASNSRTRSISTSSLGARGNPPKSKQMPPIPSAFPQVPRAVKRQNTVDEPSGIPPRTRKRQINRESMDLDDVMGDSGDDIQPPTPSTHSVKTPKEAPGKVSAATKELMDFLAQGPPGEPRRHTESLSDFLNNGVPNHHHASSVSLDTKPRGTRIRKMISKLSIGNGEKTKNGASTPTTKQIPVPVPVLPTPPRPPKLVSQSSLTGLSSLANRPIPPRPPRPPSPPPSDQEISPPPSPIKKRAPPVPYSPSPNSTGSSNRSPSPTLIPPRKDSRDRTLTRHIIATPGSASASLNGSVQSNTNGHTGSHTKQTVEVIPPKLAAAIIPPQTTDGASVLPQSILRSPKPQTDPTMTSSPTPSGPTVGLSPDEVGHLHRLMSNATSADECRLILDLFIIKHKITSNPVDTASSPPSAPTPDQEQAVSSRDATLEDSLVEFLLGEEDWLEGVPHATSNGTSTPSSINTSGADIKSPSPITASPLSSPDLNNNTLAGEMKV